MYLRVLTIEVSVGFCKNKEGKAWACGQKEKKKRDHKEVTFAWHLET